MTKLLNLIAITKHIHHAFKTNTPLYLSLKKRTVNTRLYIKNINLKYSTSGSNSFCLETLFFLSFPYSHPSLCNFSYNVPLQKEVKNINVYPGQIINRLVYTSFSKAILNFIYILRSFVGKDEEY